LDLGKSQKGSFRAKCFLYKEVEIFVMDEIIGIQNMYDTL